MGIWCKWSEFLFLSFFLSSLYLFHSIFLALSLFLSLSRCFASSSVFLSFLSTLSLSLSTPPFSSASFSHFPFLLSLFRTSSSLHLLSFCLFHSFLFYLCHALSFPPPFLPSFFLFICFCFVLYFFVYIFFYIFYFILYRESKEEPAPYFPYHDIGAVYIIHFVYQNV